MEIKETLTVFPLGFYATRIHAFHADTPTLSITETWHRRLGHPRTQMFHKIMKDAQGIPNTVHPASLKSPYLACSHGKLTIRPSPSTTNKRIPRFQERIHADVCGPVDPPSGPFQFCLTTIDTSSKWSQVSLLSTRTLGFSRLLAHILRLKAQFPDHPIKKLRVDNAGKFTSKTFDDFCVASGIEVEYPAAYVHFQNGIAESLIKRLQSIARPLIMQTKLPPSAWGHAILHAAALLRYRPSAFNASSPHHLAFGTTPSLAHLRTFG